jgi:hypothetical protein
MRQRIVKVFWWLALLGGLFGLSIWWMNRDTRWDANVALAKPGERASGRVGVIIVGVAQPSHFEKNYWIDTVDKLVATVIPWPVNRFVGADKGVVLMDPGHPYAPRAFTPTQLLDVEGRARDASGVPWIERYQRGEIIWSPPSATLTKDMGVFVCPGQKQGLSTLTAKTSAKARYLYYGQLKASRYRNGVAGRGVELCVCPADGVEDFGQRGRYFGAWFDPARLFRF